MTPYLESFHITKSVILFRLVYYFCQHITKNMTLTPGTTYTLDRFGNRARYVEQSDGLLIFKAEPNTCAMYKQWHDNTIPFKDNDGFRTLLGKYNTEC